MVTLLKHFIEAERMGNWQLHLDTIQRMLPFFHASGHFLYAKSCHLYLQDMLTLETRMDPAEYERFTIQGHFTIRRSGKFWSGVWTDMTIEQTLMWSMKTIGGLTHGRGLSESVLTKWTLGMTSVHNVCQEIEDFCGVLFDTTDQHVDMRESRIQRDSVDLAKLMTWFQNHNPFPRIDEIRSISTGIVGDNRINCHLPQELGTVNLNSIVDNNFNDVKFKR